MSDLKAEDLVYALTDTLAGVKSDTFCYIFGNIGAAAMVETLANEPAEVIAKTLGDTLINAVYDTMDEVYNLVTNFALCRTRDLVSHCKIGGRGTVGHAG